MKKIPQNPQKKLLVQKKKKNSAQLQINIQKSLLLLHTNNKETKKEIKKQLHPKK